MSKYRLRSLNFEFGPKAEHLALFVFMGTIPVGRSRSRSPAVGKSELTRRMHAMCPRGSPCTDIAHTPFVVETAGYPG
jgi:hypothetical protein